MTKIGVVLEFEFGSWSSNIKIYLSTAALPGQTTKMAITEEFMFQNVAYWPTVYITGITLLYSENDNYSLIAYKWHKSNFKNVSMKCSENNFIFLPAFYMIMGLMKAQKNFGKITILKIWELVTFWGVKIH